MRKRRYAYERTMMKKTNNNKQQNRKNILATDKKEEREKIHTTIMNQSIGGDRQEIMYTGAIFWS